MKNKYFISPSGYLISEGLVQDILNEQDDDAMLAAMKKAATSQSSATSTASAKPVGGKFIANPTEANLEKDRKTFVAIAQKWAPTVFNDSKTLFEALHKWYDGTSNEYTSVWRNWQGEWYGWDQSGPATDAVLGMYWDSESDGKWGTEIFPTLESNISTLKKNMKLYNDYHFYIWWKPDTEGESYEKFCDYLKKRKDKEGQEWIAQETGILTAEYQREYYQLLRGCYYVAQQFWRDLHVKLVPFTADSTRFTTNKLDVTLWSCLKHLQDKTLIKEIIPSGFVAAITKTFQSPF
jgi:hypothetical protein